MAAAAVRDAIAAQAADAKLAALHRDLFCEANPIPVKWALAKMGKTAAGIRSPLAPLRLDFHTRVEAALQQANCVESAGQVTNSFGWPSRDMLLQASHPNPNPNLTLICSCRLVTLTLTLI